MDLLSAVENILDDMENWPTCIILDIFVTKRNTISVLNFPAFMYGNCVPVEKAVDCFVACIRIDCYYVSCAVKDWYSIWNSNPYKTHFPKYYSTTWKRWMWLN